MSAHRLRRGFGAEVNDVFADASCMAGALHPDEIAPKRETIEALRKELWKVIRGLQKQAKGAGK